MSMISPINKSNPPVPKIAPPIIHAYATKLTTTSVNEEISLGFILSPNKTAAANIIVNILAGINELSLFL